MLKKISDDEEELMKERRLRYLFLIFIISLALSFGYILLLKFVYSEFQIQWPLILLSTLFLPLPILHWKFKNYNLTASLFFSIQSILLVLFVYFAGGLDASGVFWLSVLPVVGGVLLGRVGSIIGIVTVIGSLVGFYIFEGPSGVGLSGGHPGAKILNIISFLMYNLVIMQYFLSSERQAQTKANESKIEVENLLRILIHDVANPVVIIQTYLGRLGEFSTQPNFIKYVKKIESATATVISILTQIRQMKALKDGKSVIINRPISINEIMESVVSLQHSKAEDKSIKMNLQVPSDDILVIGDEVVLKTVVFSNLILNAIKFSPKGERIDLRVIPSENSVLVEVQDYGIGVPDEILAHIFDVTYPTSRHGTEGEKGTGYGMPLVKEYISRMNGSIDILSSEGSREGQPKGTTVQITLLKLL